MSGLSQVGPKQIIKILVGPSWRYTMQLLLDGLIGHLKMTESIGILNGISGTITSNSVRI